MTLKRMICFWAAFILAGVCILVIPKGSIKVLADEGAAAISMNVTALETNVDAEVGDTQIVHYGGQSWYVIGYDDSSMTLLAKENIDHAYYDPNSVVNNYSTSLLKTRIESIAGSFSSKEKAAVISRTLDGGSGNYGSSKYDPNKIKGNSVDALLWPLSVAEAKHVRNDLRIADPDHQGWISSFWWLRSPSYGNGFVAIVDGSGTIDDASGKQVDRYELGVRPAFYLKSSAVLFTSAVPEGKSSGNESPDALMSVGTNAGNEWKVTLLDDEHAGFTIDSANVAYDKKTGAFQVPYNGAVIGNDEYISAIIKNSDGDITYYGRIKNCASADDASGAVIINTEGKLGENDQLFVFNETFNGDVQTDFASDLTLVEIPKLTITAKDKTYVYNGQMQGPGDMAYEDPAEIAEMVEVSGLQEGDQLTSIIIDGQGKDVGEYELVVSSAAVNGKSAAEKYEVVYVPGRLTISPIIISRNVTFKVENGAWDDGTIEDKTVTLTGEEGTALKLSAEQIPAVGNNPAEQYTSGGWDVTPSVDEEITKDTTYTYTYAPKTVYQVIEGMNGKTTKGSGKSLTFKIDGDYSKFAGIRVDGKDVASSLYDSKSGSTIVTLKSAYIDQLSVGKHTIQFLYMDGSCETAFEVLKEVAPEPKPTPTPTPRPNNNTPAKTGDTSLTVVWLSLLLTSAFVICLATVLLVKRRSQKKN